MDDWFDDVPEYPVHDSHVLLWSGMDLIAAGNWYPVIAPCPFPHGYGMGDRDKALILTEHDRGEGSERRYRYVKYVQCGDCGACGPWAHLESEALRLWSLCLGNMEVAHGTH